MRVPGAKAARSSSVTNISGASVSCSTQLTTMSCSARKPASGTRPPSVSARSSGSGSSGVVLELHDRVEWIGEATAATSRWVRTSTSWTPCAFSAVTAPRAVAPKPMTAARSRRP